MERCYIKLWRKTLDNGVLQNGDLCRFWLYCLLKASHKKHRVTVGYQEVLLRPGDLIFGRKVASLELKMSERTIRTCLKTLKNMQNVTIKTTNKFSVITIVNWNTYQQENSPNDQQSDQQVTSKRPASDHKQEWKNVKNVNKVPPIPPEGLVAAAVWEEFIAHRKAIKSPLKTDYACRLIWGKLAKWKEEHGWAPEDVLNQSIEKGWKGVFEMSSNGNGFKPKLDHGDSNRYKPAKNLWQEWENQV